MQKSIKYLWVSATTFIVGYVYLRTAYMDSSSNPFGQEIVLLVLGTIATIAITAALLNKQSEVEIEKEQRVKIFDIKSNLYFELIHFIESLIQKHQVDKQDLIALEYLTHRISIIANREVLEQYSSLIEVIKKVSEDEKISIAECDELSASLAKLCGKIRYDLVPGVDNQSHEIQAIIDDNIEQL